MSQTVRNALEDAQHDVDTLLAHLSVIRDLVGLAHTAGSLEDLCYKLAAAVVTGLGYERVAVVMTRGEDVVVLETYSQALRFGAPVDACPPAMLALVWDVIAARTVIRWGGEGIGARRPAVPGIDGSVVGLPLGSGDACAGAVLCARVDQAPWDLAAQRAHELIGEIIDQIVTLAQVRMSMREIQSDLESELGATRTTIERQEETLREQSDRISSLAASVITSSRAKNHFLGVMSHELRTPLSVMLGFSSILQDGIVGPVNAEQSEYLDRVLTNGRHLTQLVDDMLFFVDAETTRIEPTWSHVNLIEMLREVVAAIPDARKPGAPSLAMAVPPETATVRTDAALLRRTLFHLLGNAFKFTDQGEVRVEVRRSAAGAGTEITITDTGAGIDPTKLRRIYELFSQADDGHTRKRDGAGLGLNLVSACVAILGGRCALGPHANGGTQVELWIPEVPADAVVRGAPGRMGVAVPRGPRGTQAPILTATDPTDDADDDTASAPHAARKAAGARFG